MKKHFNYVVTLSLVLVILFFDSNFAQLTLISKDNTISEGNIYKSESGELFTDAIVVNFKENVVDLSVGEQYATKSNIRTKYLSVTNLITQLETEYGSHKLIKQIPSAKWGDTKRRNKITGKEILIHDYSQLFTIRFDKPVPLESLIEKFEKLEEVEYVHQPITIDFHTDPPNDQYYNSNSQWHLFMIDAEGAWNISKGSSNIKIGIVDSGTDQDHPDLADKIDGGDLVEHSGNNYHGTYVAGVAGARTNNSIGIASLGWNIELNTYGYSDPDIPSYIANDIVSASSISHIINMSFGTVRLATYSDYYESMADCPNIENWMISKPWISESFPEIQYAVQDAITQGVLCIASAGNASINVDKPDPELCDPL